MRYIFLALISAISINANAVNVEDFGALCNDQADDIQAFRAALAALPPSGGVIEIPAKSCLLGGTFDINKPNVTLKGQGFAGETGTKGATR